MDDLTVYNTVLLPTEILYTEKVKRKEINSKAKMITTRSGSAANNTNKSKIFLRS